MLWLFLMIRALIPALKRKDENRHLLTLFIIASLAIAFFYAAGLMYGRQTHMAIAEYWRWWVVHLWVEGFFEVFATVVAAFLFCRLGLLRIQSATVSVLFSTIIFLSGGDPRYLPPPLLQRYAYGSACTWCYLQRSGDRAAGTHRYGGLPQL